MKAFFSVTLALLVFSSAQATDTLSLRLWGKQKSVSIRLENSGVMKLPSFIKIINSKSTGKSLLMSFNTPSKKFDFTCLYEPAPDPKYFAIKSCTTFDGYNMEDLESIEVPLDLHRTVKMSLKGSDSRFSLVVARFQVDWDS